MLNPSEISDVLKQELENINSKVKFDEVGTVLNVGDGVAHVYGLDNVLANELDSKTSEVTNLSSSKMELWASP